MGPLLDAGPHWHHRPSGHRSPGVAIIRAAARDCGWLGASPALLHSVPPQVAPQLPEGPLWRSEGQVLVRACVGARRADCLLRAVWTVFSFRHIRCSGFRSRRWPSCKHSRQDTNVRGPESKRSSRACAGRSPRAAWRVPPDRFLCVSAGAQGFEPRPPPSPDPGPVLRAPTHPPLLPAPHPSGSPDERGMCFLVPQVTGGWSPLWILIQGFQLLCSLRTFIRQVKSG